MRENHCDVGGMFRQGGLQKGQRFLGKARFGIAYRVEHNAEDFTLNPVVMHRFSPEGDVILNELFQRILPTFMLWPLFVIAYSWVEWYLSKLRSQFLPRQLVVLGRSRFDDISRRDTKSRRPLFRPQCPQIAEHGVEPLCLISSPLLGGVIVQVPQGPEVKQLLVGCVDRI